MPKHSTPQPHDELPWAIFIHRDASGLEIGPPHKETYLKGNVTDVVTKRLPRHVRDNPKASKEFGNAIYVTRAANCHDQLVESVMAPHV